MNIVYVAFFYNLYSKIEWDNYNDLFTLEGNLAMKVLFKNRFNIAQCK